MLSSYTVEKRSNNNVIMNALKLTHTQNVFAYMLQLIYDIYTYTAKTRLSFYAYTDRRDAVNQLIFRIFRSIYMHRNHIHCEDMIQSLLIYIEQWQRFCAHVATHIHHTHIHCEGTTQLLHIYRLAQCSKSIDFSYFQTDLHTLQSHTEQWQRLTQRWAHIQHSHIHCEDMIQLLHIYTLVWCNKSIDFSHYQIDLHAS